MNPKAFRALALALALALAACVDDSSQRQAADSSQRQAAKENAEKRPRLSLFHPNPQKSPAPPPNPPRLGSGPLAGFFTELAALEGGRRQEPLLILQLGDSHTAGDAFSGRLRQRFQAQFGDSGRGQLPPAVPFDYFRPRGVRVTASPGWIVSKADAPNSAGLFGISGFRARATKAGDRVGLISDEPDGFDTLLLTVLRQPLGGTLELEIDGRAVSPLPTLEGDHPQVARLQVSTPPGSRQAALTARGDGLVDLLAWGPQRQQPGIVLEAHGVIGATIKLLRKFDPVTAGFELTSRKAALILLAFGTNEGFQDGWSAESYFAEADAALADLRRLAPESDIVILGPPDGNRLAPPGCRSAPASPCSLSGGADRPSGVKKNRLCRWIVPPNLGMVRQTLARVAQSGKVYFWDWSQVMGACGANQWAQMKPPLAGQDRIHYRPEGYARAADALYDRLMLEYAAWKHAAGMR